MTPIPAHLVRPWYAPHCAWVRETYGVVTHDPGDAAPVRADLSGADLSGADLSGADLSGADLSGAYLRAANLSGADLSGADLRAANLRAANLSGADLSGADLRAANLRAANLRAANLSGATLPDGRTLEAYRADPLAGICDAPEARARAVAAWGSHTWRDCPMHAAHGWGRIDDAPEDRRRDVAAFVALFDARLLDDYPARASAAAGGGA